jgi:hypothetical protein
MALQESSQTISQTSIPDYAKPFVEDLLGKAQYFTDTEQNPYMQYQGQRQAQFTPLQQQAFTNAGLMQTAPQLQDASAMAGMAGLGALNTQYTFRPSDFGAAFSAANTKDAQGNVTGNTMMSPYMDSIVARQQADARRQSDIAMQAQNAQAARSGAFGGSGNQMMRMQAMGNLARQQGDIQAKGLQDAYQQAMGQYNTQNQQNAQQQQFGAGLGLQGLQTAMTGAKSLADIGQTQYGQNMGIMNAQNQYGLQKQQQTQNILNNQYQDFLNYQNYPYKQMGFMSDILRGLPLTQTASSVYQAPPSTGSQLLGAGATAAGLALRAKGGSVGEAEDIAYRDKPAGLADLALSRMG